METKQTYRARWEIDVDGQTAEDAARAAEAIMRTAIDGTRDQARVFDVRPFDGPADRWTQIDLAAMPPVGPLHTPHLLAEAALCAWEWMNDHSLGDAAERKHPTLYKLRRDIGTVELRHLAMDLAPFIMDVYDRLPDKTKQAGSYDWDIIPTILTTVDWARGKDGTPPVNNAVMAVISDLHWNPKSRPPKTPEDRSLYSDVEVMPPQKLYKRSRSWKLFKTLFAPIERAPGDYQWEALDVPEDADERHWWSIVDHDPVGPRWHLMPGFIHSNQLGRIRCANPWGGKAEDHPMYVL